MVDNNGVLLYQEGKMDRVFIISLFTLYVCNFQSKETKKF